MRTELAGRTVSAFATGPSAAWVDFYEYAGRLLARGAVPWLDQARFAAFHSQAQGLLKSGVVELPLEPILRAMAAASDDLARDMRGKSRLGYPLRVLLGHPALRESLIALLAPLRSANPTRPLVLSMPSPGRLLELAYELAHRAPPTSPVGPEDAANAAVYLADLLGALSESRLDGLLIIEPPTVSDLADEWLESYEPIVNKAQHYRWEVGLMAAGAENAVPAEAGFDYQIGMGRSPGRIGHLIRYGAEGPSGAIEKEGVGFYYITMSGDVIPERLLSWLEQFR